MLSLATWSAAAVALVVLLAIHDIRRAQSVAPDIWPSPQLLFFGAVALYVLHHLVEPADVERRWLPPYAAYVEVAWRHAFQIPLSLGFAAVLRGVFALGAGAVPVFAEMMGPQAPGRPQALPAPY